VAHAFQQVQRQQQCRRGNRNDGVYALTLWSLVPIPLSNEDSNCCYLQHEPAVTTTTRSADIAVDDGSDEADNDFDFVDDLIQQDYDVWIPAGGNAPGDGDAPIPLLLEWKFDILFNETWNVPVLYFVASRRLPSRDNVAGLVLSRSDVVAHLRRTHHQNRTDDDWEFVSQEEHPVTGIPAFFLHPCRTKERFDRLYEVRATLGNDYDRSVVESGDDDKKEEEGVGDDDVNDDDNEDGMCLLLWMSLVLPSVGHAIPSRVFQQAREEINTACRTEKKTEEVDNRG